MNFFRKAKTLLETPGMLGTWVRWQIRHLGVAPSVTLNGGIRVGGFRDFSEYWSVIHMVPPQEEMRFIEKYAGSTGLMLDVGGNVGCMALTLSRLRPDLEVHSLEPSPETFCSLTANIAANRGRRVRCHQLAAGAMCGQMAFSNDIHTPALNRLVSDAETICRPVINVAIITLDSFIMELGVDQVAFLKIDVEGYEPSVISGAARLLAEKKCCAGLVELCPSNLKNVGHSVIDLLQAVEQVGYALYFLTPDGEPGERVTEANGEDQFLTNVAMLPV